MENKYKHFCSSCYKILYNSIVGKVLIAIYNFFSKLASGSFLFNIFNRGTVDGILEKESVFKRICSFFDNILESFYKVLRNSFFVNKISKGFNILLCSPISCITSIIAPFSFISCIISFIKKNFLVASFMILIFFISFLFLKNIRFKEAFSVSFIQSIIFKLMGLDTSSFEEVKVSTKKANIVCAFVGIFMGVISYFSLTKSVIVLAVFIGAFLVFSVKPVVFGCIFMFSVPLLPTIINVSIIFLFLINFIMARAFNKIQKKPLNLVEVFTIIFILFLIVSSFLSVSPIASIKVAAVWISMILSFFAIRRCIENKNDLISILTTFSLAALITALYGIHQYFYGKVDPSWVDTSLFSNLKFRVYSTFENPNVYGEYLLLAIPIIAGLMVLTTKKLTKISTLFITGILTVDLFLTYSRGCYLGLGLCIFMLIWLFDTKLVFIPIIGAIPLIYLLPESITSRLLSITNLSDSSTSYRIKIWEGTFKVIEKFGITGVGPGTEAFNTVYSKYALDGITAQHSHNLFLQIIAEAGIFAFIIFIAILFCYMRNGISTIRKTTNLKNKFFMSVFIAALLGFIVQSMFDYTWYNYRVFMIFWIFLALGNTAFELFKPLEKNFGGKNK